MSDRVGVLALQGCIEPHLRMLEKLGARAILVRSIEELGQIDRLILPGGESSTMLKLLGLRQMFDPLKSFCASHPVWGICAGAILLAQEVKNPVQPSLASISIRAVRNYYGSQLDSFKTEVEISCLGVRMQVDFIRAPLLEPLDPSVKVYASHAGRSVLLRQGRVLVSSFHTELGSVAKLHEYFLKM